MTDLKERLHGGIAMIAGRPVTWDESLVGGAIDSLALVEVVNLVEELARETKVRVDLDRLISEERLTVEKIHAAMTRVEP